MGIERVVQLGRNFMQQNIATSCQSLKGHCHAQQLGMRPAAGRRGMDPPPVFHRFESFQSQLRFRQKPHHWSSFEPAKRMVCRLFESEQKRGNQSFDRTSHCKETSVRRTDVVVFLCFSLKLISKSLKRFLDCFGVSRTIYLYLVLCTLAFRDFDLLENSTIGLFEAKGGTAIRCTSSKKKTCTILTSKLAMS